MSDTYFTKRTARGSGDVRRVVSAGINSVLSVAPLKRMRCTVRRYGPARMGLGLGLGMGLGLEALRVRMRGPQALGVRTQRASGKKQARLEPWVPRPPPPLPHRRRCQDGEFGQ